MLNRTFPAFIIGLVVLAWPLSSPALQTGVLTAKAIAAPKRILPEGKTKITVTALDGFQQPVAGVSVKIVIDTGYFEQTNRPAVFGFTDKLGQFQAVWHANLQTKPGSQEFAVTATKSGYVSKYPLTASAKVEVVDPSKPSEETAHPNTEDNPQDESKE